MRLRSVPQRIHADGSNACCHLVLGHAQVGAVEVFADRERLRLNRALSHHRTTGNNLLRLGLEAACCLDQFLGVGSDLNTEVSRICDRVTGYGEYTLDQRSGLAYCIINSDHSTNIVHDAACVCWKHGGIYTLPVTA